MLNRLPDVFASFHSHDVKYVVIGGIAAVLYGVPPATFDLDILIDASRENAESLLSSLEDVGFGTASLITADELIANEITVFNDRVRIDVLTRTPGLAFGDAWKRKTTMTFRGTEFYVASLEDVIASKRAAGREIDVDDARLLDPGSDRAP